MFLNEDGTFAENWREGLPEEIRTEESLGNVKDFSDLATQYVHAQKTIGKKGVIVPTDKSPDTEWDAFFTAIGRPKTAGDYTAEVPDQLSQIYTEERIGALKEMAHKIGVTDKQFNAFLKMDMENTVNILKAEEEAEEQQRINAEEELRKRFGAAFEERRHIASRLLAELRPNPSERMVIQEKWGNDPDFIELFSEAGAKLVESEALVATLQETTPKEAERELESIRNTPGFILPDADGNLLKDTNPARHQELIRQQQEIIQKTFVPK
jgi:hypothetical protein